MLIKVHKLKLQYYLQHRYRHVWVREPVRCKKTPKGHSIELPRTTHQGEPSLVAYSCTKLWKKKTVTHHNQELLVSLKLIFPFDCSLEISILMQTDDSVGKTEWLCAWICKQGPLNRLISMHWSQHSVITSSREKWLWFCYFVWLKMSLQE